MSEQHSLTDWQILAEKSLKGASLDSLNHSTASGLSFEPLYHTRPDTKSILHGPGLQRWDNRLNVLGTSAAEQNSHALNGLSGGIGSLQLCVGQNSPLAIASIANVLDGVQLDLATVSLQAGMEFTGASETLHELWVSRGFTAEQINMSVNADPIGTIAANGLPVESLDRALSDLCKLVQTSSQSMPNARAVGVNVVAYHNAGATMQQELCSAMSTAVTYLESMIQHGLTETQAVNSIVFQLACDADHIANVVKLRALRALWHHIATAFGVQTPSTQMVVETSQRMLSKRSVWVNHLRNVSAASAAAMGGAEAIIVHPHNIVDSAILDSQFDIAARVARNTAHMLSDEAAMTFVHDPMAGAFAIEQLTHELTSSTWQQLQQLELDGGLVHCLKTGEWQTQIAAAHAHRIQRLQNEDDIAVGVNRFNSDALTQSDNNDTTAVSNDSAGVVALQGVREAAAFEHNETERTS